MKKILSILFLALLVISFFTPASASTLSFSPVSIKVVKGQKFNLKINVTPVGGKNYTVKTNIKFPANLVKVDSWTYGTNWMPIRKPNYDYLSNSEGLVTRTAGYPEGFSSAVTFGTISFIAKSDGEGVVEFTGENLILDDSNNNDYTSGNKVNISVKEITEEVPLEIKPTEVKPEVSFFDVSLELDKTLVDRIEDIGIKATFRGMENIPANIGLTFDILNSNGDVVRTDFDQVVIQGEGVFDKKFTDFVLVPGKYTLRLITLYNTNIQNEFRKDFEIGQKVPLVASSISQILLIFGLIAIVSALLFLFKRKHKK